MPADTSSIILRTTASPQAAALQSTPRSTNRAIDPRSPADRDEIGRPTHPQAAGTHRRVLGYKTWSDPSATRNPEGHSARERSEDPYRQPTHYRRALAGSTAP